ncbi:ATP-binding cassette domain-containing protein [Spirosoma rhododendri]|uniref:ATP-binding cassette domain-containing protein n=1 Tax=Spirosoma rhododendri TaxID=2728024 RepID=A0A7L5DIY0_9BACT|nr:ATP-binding cassette domain-containing protein [Spirosoma rhododendri]QJD78354.1 ATP-binding cassette domain-containing protein [Spirosoma rhododendri]
MQTPEPLFSLTNLTVKRGAVAVLTNLSLVINRAECWAIVGPVGSGKTTLAQVLAGQLATTREQIPVRTPATLVSFREESHQFSYTRHFYQQRYQATLSDNQDGQAALTVRRYLEPTGTAQTDEATALIQRMGIEPLLDVEFLKLSNGQTRKARIAKALLQHPAMLLLDNPFVGLDAHFRSELTTWLGELVQGGQPLLLIADRNHIPEFVTHVLALDAGQVTYAGPVAGFVPSPVTLPNRPLPILRTPPQPADFADAFRLTDVTVKYGEKRLLDSVSWTVRAGERWALLGHNGAGKSILLSVLYGDHPQAYANQVAVFDHRRGKPGTNIWDVKRRIGFISPELHLYFPRQLTVRQVGLTGLTDTLVVPARPSADAVHDLDALLTYFGIDHLADRPFGTLSTGEQRITLLIRALLKNAPMLILDEPFQALDARQAEQARQLLDSLPDKTIVFVTHDSAELPTSVDRRIDIQGGRLAEPKTESALSN